MDIYNYGTMQGEKNRRKRRRITGIVLIIIILLTGLAAIGVLTSNGPEYQMRKSIIEENHVLKEENAELKDELQQLKKELKEKSEYIENLPEDTITEPDEAEDELSTPRD